MAMRQPTCDGCGQAIDGDDIVVVRRYTYNGNAGRYIPTDDVLGEFHDTEACRAHIQEQSWDE